MLGTVLTDCLWAKRNTAGHYGAPRRQIDSCTNIALHSNQRLVIEVLGEVGNTRSHIQRYVAKGLFTLVIDLQGIAVGVPSL